MLESESDSDIETAVPRVSDEQPKQSSRRAAFPRTGVPSLVELCLESLLDYCRGRYFAEILVPYLPLHLRRTLLRWTAVHSPLPTSKLLSLSEPEGHINGELIVVGPQASLTTGLFSPDDQDEERNEDTFSLTLQLERDA